MLKREEFASVMNRAILGTMDNYPTNSVGFQIQHAYNRYKMELAAKKGHDIAIESFCNCFSRNNKKYGLNLRESIFYFYDIYDIDVALEFLDVLKKYCENNYDNEDFSIMEQNTMMKYYIEYIKIVNSADRTLRDIELFLSDSDLSNLIVLLPPIVNIYYKSLKEKEVYNFPEISLIEVTKTAQSYLMNVDQIGELLDSFSGELLEGKITIASDRGYSSRPNKPQQDAVLSVTKSNSCYLNAVADGVGDSQMGEKVSEYTVVYLKKWFESVPEESFLNYSVDELKKIIDDVLKKINDKMNYEFYGRAQATIVLALTRGEDTVIANIGDSTAYQYDEKTDKLVELTTTDSYARGLDYEEARNLPGNNQIFNALGYKPSLENEEFAHYNVIPNNGGKIILSSDGVTDLIHENRFKKYFIEGQDAKKIVEDAVYHPDESKTGKIEDNVSAIVIELPSSQHKLGRRI